jgi:hypothetical protein
LQIWDFKKRETEILLWERLSRPPRLSESDGGQAAAIALEVGLIEAKKVFLPKKDSAKKIWP